MSTSEDSPWSTLFPHVIDGVVAALKHRHRWLHDGPSLRGLNHHWCRCLSNNVTSILPHSSRPLHPEDAKSLFKFRRATRVDVGAFFSQGITEERASTVLKGLGAMESLSDLVLDVSPGSEVLLSSRHLAELPHLRSLTLKACPHHSRGIPDALIEPLRHLQLTELTLEACITDLSCVLENVPSLKKLCVEEHSVTPSEDTLSKMQTLESISLNQTSLAIPQLMAFASLECVGIAIEPQDIPAVAQLAQLKALTLRLLPSGQTTVNLDSLSNLPKLTSLELFPFTNERLSLELKTPLKRLARLIVTKVVVQGSQVKECMQGLQIFGATDCLVRGADEFLKAFKNVERFCLLHVLDETGEALHPSWTPTDFPKLSVVCVQISDADGVAGLDALLRLTQIEKLSLAFSGESQDLRERFFEELKNLDGLESLRELTIDEFGSIQELTAFLERSVVTQLDVLALDLDAISTADRDEVVKTLQRKAPHLKLSTSWLDVVKTVIQWSYF